MAKATTAKTTAANKASAEKTFKTAQNTVKAAQDKVQETVKETVKVAQDTVKAAQDKAQKTVKETVKVAQKTVKAAQDKAQETVKVTKENVEKAVKEATQNFDDVSAFSKANYDAVVASGNVAVKVAQNVNADLLENTKKAAEQNVADMKKLFSAKSPVEFFELQSAMFKTRYDDFVSESSRINDVTTKTVNEVVEPLKARYEEVASQYNLPVAG